MSEYLQDPFNEASHAQFVQLVQQYLKQTDNQSNKEVWLIGDGSFSDAPLVDAILPWQPVFTTEPMSQYEEMGLFMARLQTHELGLERAVNQLERFTGLPMFSVIVTSQPQEALAQMLTWLADAHTDDGLSLYLRIGDTRCLPYIFDSVNRTQSNYIASMVDEWHWFGRDAQWNGRIDTRKARATLPTDYTPPTTPNVIDSVQFDKLIEGGEVDLVYSLISEIDERIYPNHFTQMKKFEILLRLIKEAKQNQILDMVEIRDYVLDGLLILSGNTPMNASTTLIEES